MFNGLQGLCRKPQGDITTLQVQQLGLPPNGAEAGNSSSYAIGYDFSSLLDTPADNDSTIIIHAHQVGVPNSHTHEVGSRRTRILLGSTRLSPGDPSLQKPLALRTVAAAVGRPRPAAARYSMPRTAGSVSCERSPVK